MAERKLIDSQSVGTLTRSVTEVLDVRKVSAFLSAIGEDTKDISSGGDPFALVVHPCLAFALQYRAQGRPSLFPLIKANWVGAAVHASTDLRILRPLRLGQVVTTQGQIIERRQIAPGVFNLERYRLRDERGELLAELDFGLIFRGFTLEGEDVEIEASAPLPVRQSGDGGLEAIFPITFQRSLAHNFTAGTGIYEAIHTDPEIARNAGFDDIVVQGSAVQSVICSILSKQYCDGDIGRMVRFAARMRAPILADTQAELRIEGTAQSEGITTIFFTLINCAGETAIANGVFAARGM